MVFASKELLAARRQVDEWARTSPPPIETREVHVAYQGSTWRLEANRVVGAATANDAIVERLAPLADWQYRLIVVPTLGDRFVLAPQYRYPLRKWSLEFLVGRSVEPDMTWSQTARATLRETAGLGSDELRLLGSINLDPEYWAGATLVVEAQDCRRLDTAPDAPRAWPATIEVSNGCLDAMIAAGDVEAGPTLAAWCLHRAQSMRGWFGI